MKYESKSDTISVCKILHRSSGLYSLKGINCFLHETFKKSVKLTDYFIDADKFIRSLDILKRLNLDS